MGQIKDPSSLTMEEGKYGTVGSEAVCGRPLVARGGTSQVPPVLAPNLGAGVWLGQGKLS